MIRNSLSRNDLSLETTIDFNHYKANTNKYPILVANDSFKGAIQLFI